MSPDWFIRRHLSYMLVMAVVGLAVFYLLT